MFRQGFTCPALLEDLCLPLPVRGCHPLWRAFPDASGSQSRGHWPGPRSLVTTDGVSVDVLSSGYLDISVRRVRLLPLWIHDRIPPKGWVAPFGDLGITGRSPLPRAFRSVPRPSSPLGAKASTRCPSRARPRPAPRPRLRAPRARRRFAPTGTTRPGVSAYPCPGTTDRPPSPAQAQPEGCARKVPAASPVMPASRSRLASRCQNVTRPTPPSPGDARRFLSGRLRRMAKPSPISPTPVGGPGPI
jgi:hypothetical protein